MELLLGGFAPCFPGVYALLGEVSGGCADPRLLGHLVLLRNSATASRSVCQCELTRSASRVAVEWRADTVSSCKPGCEVLWALAVCLSAPLQPGSGGGGC